MAPREFDVANLVTRLEHAGYFPQRARTYQRLCDEFLTGYGLDILTTPTYSFCYLQQKLKMLETLGHRGFAFLYFKREGVQELCNWLDSVD
jgi:hypothetical protein